MAIRAKPLGSAQGKSRLTVTPFLSPIRASALCLCLKIYLPLPFSTVLQGIRAIFLCLVFAFALSGCSRQSPRMRSLAHNLDKPRRVAWLHFAWRKNNRVLQKAEMKVQGVRGHKHTLISISHAHADAYANAPMRMQNTIELLEMQAQGGLALRWQRTRG